MTVKAQHFLHNLNRVVSKVYCSVRVYAFDAVVLTGPFIQIDSFFLSDAVGKTQTHSAAVDMDGIAPH